LAISPLISNAQPIVNLPGTVTSGDIVFGGQTIVKVNTAKPVICFEEEDAKQMVVQLENSIDYEDQSENLKQGTAELEKQIALLKEINKLQMEQLNISKQTIESYKELTKVQKEAYEKHIDNIKPSIWDKIFPSLGGVGIGVLIGLLLL
jgi:hypothetical protein